MGRGKYGSMTFGRVPAMRGTFTLGKRAHRYGVCRVCLRTFAPGDKVREAPRLRRIFQHVTCPKVG